MNRCCECGGELVNATNSEFLVCKQCGLLSDIRVFSFLGDSFPEERSIAKRKKIKIEASYSRLLRSLRLPKKYEKKINDEVLIKVKKISEEIKNPAIRRKKFYEILRESKYNFLDVNLIEEIKKYKNIAKVFLNGNGSDAIFEAITLIYYLKKKNKKISYEKVAEIMNVGKNNLFKRYKEFEKRIKIYERQGLRRLIILKLLNQPRLKCLTLKEIALIAGVRHDSARALQMRIKRALPNIVDEKALLGH